MCASHVHFTRRFTPPMTIIAYPSSIFRAGLTMLEKDALVVVSTKHHNTWVPANDTQHSIADKYHEMWLIEEKSWQVPLCRCLSFISIAHHASKFVAA